MSDSEDDYGPALPPGFPSSKTVDTSSDDEAYGPALPASLSSKPRTSKDANRPKCSSQDSSDSDSDSDSEESETDISSSKRQRTTIGPSIPAHIMQAKSTQKEATEKDSKYIGPVLPSHLKHLEQTSVSAVKDSGEDYDSDDGMIGPCLGLQATGDEMTSAAEFEMRAQKMHAKLTGKSDDVEADAPVARESWMTELPSADMGKKAFGLANRNFRKNEAPQADSSWTDTPQDKERKEKEKAEAEQGSKRKKAADHYVPTERDKKMEKEIEQYNKAHRPDSLMAMHEKKLKKKKKKERKKEKKEKKKNKKDKKEKKPEERRPFDRDTDLAINKFDEAQRKAFIKRSQELTSRFKTGGMGTSFL